jgi:hypothetical protein
LNGFINQQLFKELRDQHSFTDHEKEHICSEAYYLAENYTENSVICSQAILKQFVFASVSKLMKIQNALLASCPSGDEPQ